MSEGQAEKQERAQGEAGESRGALGGGGSGGGGSGGGGSAVGGGGGGRGAGGGSVRLDGGLLRALAHPMRNRIVGLLRVYGPQTATTLAGRLGVNTGATSYHLRQLADAGLVVEDADRGNARDRWWKAAHQGTEFDAAEMLQSEPELALGFLHGIGQTYAENMFRAIDEWQTLEPEWREATLLSDYVFHLTAAELKAMMTEVTAVLDKYRADLTAPMPEGASQVSVQLQAYRRDLG